jgi:ABC-type Fe3+-hydroxamate transport system substrate-binding protein
LSWGELIAGDNRLQTLTNVYGASAGTASIAAIVLEGLGKMSLLIFGSAAKKLMEEVRREGREKGREEEREKWLAWDARRREAQARNESFDEPPP